MRKHPTTMTPSRRNGCVAVGWGVVILLFIGSRCTTPTAEVEELEPGRQAAITACTLAAKQQRAVGFTVSRTQSLSSGGWHVIMVKGQQSVSCATDQQQRVIGVIVEKGVHGAGH